MYWVILLSVAVLMGCALSLTMGSPLFFIVLFGACIWPILLPWLWFKHTKSRNNDAINS